MRRNAAEKTHLALALRRFKESRKSLPRPALIKRRLLLLSLPGPGYYTREEAVTISPDPDSKQQESFFFFSSQGRTIVFSWPNRAARDCEMHGLPRLLIVSSCFKDPQSVRGILLLTYCYCYYFLHSVDRGANDFFLFPSPQVEEKCRYKPGNRAWVCDSVLVFVTRTTDVT